MNRLSSPLTRLVGAALSVAVVASPVALAPTVAVAQSQGDLARAAQALRGISTMTANFVQSDRSGQRVSGVMSLKRPGKIRFEYQKNVPLLIVSDGHALTLVDYGVKQVQRWPIGNSPLGALLDPSKDLSKYGKAVPTGNPDVVAVEVKDPKRREFGTITLIFMKDAAAPGGLKLASWVALDAQNKRTTVALSNQRYGVAIPDSRFTFRDPRPTTRR